MLRSKSTDMSLSALSMRLLLDKHSHSQISDEIRKRRQYKVEAT